MFAWLARWLFALDDRGEWSFWLAHLLVMVATYAAIYRWITTLTACRRVPIFLALAGWLALTEGRALAGSYLWGGYLQPSSLATLAWLVAIASWMRGRIVAASLVLAVGGAFHVNFAFLGAGVLGLAELATGGPWRTRLVRLAILAAPSLAVFVALIRGQLPTAGEPALALEVLTRFHAPGHYDPGRVIARLPVLLAWLVVAWAALPVARSAAHAATDVAPHAAADAGPHTVADIATQAAPHAAIDRLWRFTWIASAICAVVSAAIFVPGLLPLTRLYVWRLAPFAQLGGLVIASLAGFALLDDPARWRVIPPWRRAVWLAGAVAASALTALWLERLIGFHALALPITAGTDMLTALLVRRIRLRVAIVGLAMFGLAVFATRGALAGAHIFVDPRADDSELFRWTRTIEVDAVFLTPPAFGTFRLLSRRAIVADTKSPPLAPDELVAWYRRLCGVVDARDVATHEEVERRYGQLAIAQLLAIAHRFGASYLVIEKRANESAAAPIAFENGSFVAYRVP